MKRRNRSYHHGGLRPALIETTARLLAERGQATVSLREAARRVGVSEAAPYQHFRSKSALLAGVADAGFELLHASLLAALSGPPSDPLARLEALCVAYVRFALDRPHYFRLMVGHGPEADQLVKTAASARLLDDFLEPVRAARLSHGHEDEEPVKTAVLLWSVPHGLTLLYLEQSIDAGIVPRVLEDLIRAGVRALVRAPLPEVQSDDPQWGI